VLDLGFNLLRSLPVDAFRGVQSLTLLALDGNPMASLPETSFLHLNTSLRGLSLGGRCGAGRPQWTDRASGS
jgi:hypothetical protein